MTTFDTKVVQVCANNTDAWSGNEPPVPDGGRAVRMAEPKRREEEAGRAAD